MADAINDIRVGRRYSNLYQVNITQQLKWAADKGPLASRRPYHVRKLPQIIAFSSRSGFEEEKKKIKSRKLFHSRLQHYTKCLFHLEQGYANLPEI